MFKFLFKCLSIKSLLIEQPKQNNIHFDVERREKMKKLNAEINQHYETLQQSYATQVEMMLVIIQTMIIHPVMIVQKAAAEAVIVVVINYSCYKPTQNWSNVIKNPKLSI